jgi:hypothetical protein
MAWEEERFIKARSSSADTLRQHIVVLVRNWILALRSNENKIPKQTKCDARFENSIFQY